MEGMASPGATPTTAKRLGKPHRRLFAPCPNFSVARVRRAPSETLLRPRSHLCHWIERLTPPFFCYDSAHLFLGHTDANVINPIESPH